MTSDDQMSDQILESVIYILSNGRSGSTILEMLLASADNKWTTGEVQLLDLELAINAPCGSGEPIQKSDYWQPILNNISFSDQNASISFFRKTAASGLSHHGKVIRWNHLAVMLGWKRPNPDFKRSYNSLNENLYNQCLKQANAISDHHIDYLIDSSKDPYRYFYFTLNNPNMPVIHLVKHPESFVYSQIKTQKGMMRLKGLVRFSLRWVIENKIMAIASKKSKRKVLISYENLARYPEATLKYLDNQLDTGDGSYKVTRFRESRNYGISGNKSRFAGDAIKYDNKWETGLSSLERLIINTICYLFAGRLSKEVKKAIE